jgi:hypothetical protein
MASAKKYQNFYKDSEDEHFATESQIEQDKAIIQSYINKIADIIDKDQEKQRKAAQIVHNLINSSSKKGKR